MLPYIRTHAIAVHQAHIMLILERMGLTVDQVTAHFTDILENEVANNEYHDLLPIYADIHGRLSRCI